MPSAARRQRRAPVTFNQAPDGSVTLQPGDAPTWSQYVTDFDAAVSQAQAVLTDLQAQTPPADATALEAYNQLVSDGQGWLTKLRNLQSMRDSVASWVSGLVTSAEQTADIYAQEGIPLGRAPGGQLGIVPLVIAGIGLASFAAVVYGALQWAQQASRFSQLNAMAQAAIARGADPQAAYAQAGKTLNITAGSPGGGFFSSLGSNLVWAGALVVLALWLGPKVLDRLTGSRAA